jgi:hypothetical protein
MIDPTTIEPMPAQDPDAGFWSQTTELQHIHAFARSRGASPYATLGSVLRRVAGCVEPFVVLPPTVGGQVSLNLFTAQVGRSGAGKDIANAAGRDAVAFHITLGTSIEPLRDADPINPGSGEGLARIFAGGKNQPPKTRAHLQVPDVATLEALAGRKGQTLVGQLLAAYMGQPIGFHNAQKETTSAVEEHKYRLCLGVGVQPENAGFFLSQASHGFPQRFLWLPTNDPHAPQERPEPLKTLDVEIPSFILDKHGWRVLQIPEEVAEEIWHHRWLVLKGAEGVDPLDAHVRLTQLKVAAAVAILHGGTGVSSDAWKIAGQLIDVSTQTRAGLAAAVAARTRRENTARALDAADRQAIIADRLSEESQQRVARAITGKLKRVGSSTRRDLLMACHSSIRAEFPTVFDLFLDKGFIVQCDVVEGGAHRYRLTAEFSV